MEVAHPGFGSGLSAAIERHHRSTLASNQDRLEPVPPVEPGLPAAVRPRSRTRGVVELAVGVAGALVVIDGGLRAWRHRRA